MRSLLGHVVSMAMLLAGAGVGAAGGQTEPVRELDPKPDNEIDRFMADVLARRDTNSVTLRQYVLDEEERFEIVGPGRAPLWRGRREFTWYEQGGILVRSPVRFDGVVIDETQRRAYEAEWLERERRRARRRERGTAPLDRRSSRSTRDNVDLAIERLWGGDIDDPLLGDIVDDARTWGDDHAAITAAGAAILEARGGVSAVGVEVAVARARDGFVMLEAGRLGRSEVTALIDGIVPRVVAAVEGAASDDEFAGSAELVELVELAREFELSWAELPVSSAALTALVDALGADSTQGTRLRDAVAALPRDLPAAAEATSLVDAGGLQPRFVSESYFLDFEFEPGNYYLAGRETLAGREVLRIEYYPTALFSEADEDDPEIDDELEARVESGFEKTSLVTLWIEPEERQIVRFTFDNVGFDFLPGRWLVRLDDLTASMTMGQPMADVWLPTTLELRGQLTLATGTYRVAYSRVFSNYREATSGGRLGDADPTPVPR